MLCSLLLCCRWCCWGSRGAPARVQKEKSYYNNLTKAHLESAQPQPPLSSLSRSPPTKQAPHPCISPSLTLYDEGGNTVPTYCTRTVHYGVHSVRVLYTYVYGSAVVAVLRYRYRYRSSVRTTRTRTYVHGTVLHVVHMYTNTGTFVLYMYILIHAYMYATESKVLGLDQIGVFQTTESSL